MGAIISFLGSFAQNATIKGNIQQTDSTTVLPGVSVYLEKTNIGTSSNGNGNYIISKVPAGDYTLIVSSIGYNPIRKEITVENNSTITLNFILTESISILTGVTVTGGNIGIKDIPGSVHYI